MRNKINSIWNWAKHHKFWAILILLVVIFGGYKLYGVIFPTVEEVRYITSGVKKGEVLVTVTGTGQVSASNQLDLKARASGDVVLVPVLEGAQVKAGTLIMQLDTRDALKSIRDAEASLESAKLSLEKLKQPPDQLSLIQAENSLAKAKENKANAESDLSKAYEDGFNSVSDAFLDLPTVVTGLQETFFSSNSALGGQWGSDFYAGAAGTYNYLLAEQYKKDLADDYAAMRVAYDKSFADYKATSRFSSSQKVEEIISSTYEMGKLVAETVKSGNNLIQFYSDEMTKRNIRPNSEATADLTTLSSYTSQVNSHLTNLLNARNSIKSYKDAIVNSERSIQENVESLADLKNGADPLDVRSSEISVTQKENALRDIREKLSDYYLKAPFDGTVASIAIKKLDSVSNGSVVASLLTSQKIAEVTLNEVDVAKVVTGQKANLTFDALPDLKLEGLVTSVDSLATVSQGVVNYTVKISFNADGTMIKPGMSVSASIITDSKQDVLYVSAGSIKIFGEKSFVEVLENVPPKYNPTEGFVSATAPRRQEVSTGLSNDTQTEIVSGLKEGDQIVIKTITSSATTQTAPSATSLFGGSRTGTSGGTRIPR